TPRGFAVVIDHGALGFATYYAHLSRLLVTPTQQGRSGQRVYAGQPIGVVGADPTDPWGAPHLHFELWKGGPGDAIDPAPVLRWWECLAVPSTPPPPVSMPAPAPPSPSPTASAASGTTPTPAMTPPAANTFHPAQPADPASRATPTAPRSPAVTGLPST